jgi:hypothetical protein
MATFVNNLRLKEITTGDEDGTWGTSTNTNLELITDGFSYGTKQMSADANETFTMPDATTDATRGFYLKITSAGSLTATREVTLGPNTISKVWLIENSTTGSQIITIKQGSGATVNIANGSKVMVVTDGVGAGAAVINDKQTHTTVGDVTLNGVQTLTNKTLTSPVLGGITTTASGSMEFAPANYTMVVRGGGSDEGSITLNCAVNTHGQTITSQPHSATVTNTMMLPAGADSTLVSLVSTDTLTNKTLTSPRIGTYILDTNGLELINLTATASAVNEITLANAATGANPTITPSGGDTNVGLNITPKGTGELNVDASFLTGIFSDKVSAIGNTGTAQTINVGTAQVFTATLNGNCTFTLSGANSNSSRASSFTLILANDGTPSRTVAFAGGNFLYPGGSVSRTTTASAVDVWFFFTPDSGTTWYITIPMKDLS